jgi:hypothetical protein
LKRDVLGPGDRVKWKRAHLASGRRRDPRWYKEQRHEVGTVVSEVTYPAPMAGHTFAPEVIVVWDVRGRPGHERSRVQADRLEKLGTNYLTSAHAWLATKRSAL